MKLSETQFTENIYYDLILRCELMVSRCMSQPLQELHIINNSSKQHNFKIYTVKTKVMAFNRTVKEFNHFGCSKLYKNNTDVMSCQVTTCMRNNLTHFKNQQNAYIVEII